MRKFETIKTINIKSTQVGPDRKLKPAELFSLMTDMALENIEDLGYGREKTLDKGILWVVVLTRVEIERLPLYGEKIKMSTRPGICRHMMFYRYFDMTDEKGNRIVSAASMWTLIDENTRKIVFPETLGLNLPEGDQESDINLPRRLRGLFFETSSEMTANYGMCDINGHLNNARYIELAYDIYDHAGKDLSKIEVEYSAEIPMGKSFVISSGRRENQEYFSGDSDMNHFKILMEYHDSRF